MSGQTPDDVRVLIVDDHPIFREGLRTVLSASPGVEVVGDVGTGEEAVTAAGRLHPDVILMDLRMPGLSGFEAIRRIAESTADIGILVLTMFDDDDSVLSAMRAGARGYVLKDASRTEIVRAVQAVATGEAVFGSAVARRLLSHVSQGLPTLPFPDLTPRERTILDLMAAGDNNPTIAQKLGLSHKTIRNQISVIFTKLQVSDRGQAIVRAREAGLGTTSGGNQPGF